MDVKSLAGTPVTGEENVLRTCKNCSNRFEGRFCNRCGEKVIEEHERSMLYFLEGVFHAITHVDGKIFRNLKLMLINPGFISKNYAEGVRQPFMKPIPMFFVANLIYFLFPFFNTFNTNLSSQINSQPYSSAIRPIVDKKEKEENISFESLQQKYNAKTSTLSKLMLIVFVPTLALVLAILNFGRQRYFADHILMGLEFMCFILFYICILFGGILALVRFVAHYIHIDVSVILNNEIIVVVPVALTMMMYFLFRSERTFYNQRIIWAILKSFVFVAALFWIMTGYRYMLFYVTINSI
jgi:hypothetical protein